MEEKEKPLDSQKMNAEHPMDSDPSPETDAGGIEGTAGVDATSCDTTTSPLTESQQDTSENTTAATAPPDTVDQQMEETATETDPPAETTTSEIPEAPVSEVTQTTSPTANISPSPAPHSPTNQLPEVQPTSAEPQDSLATTSVTTTDTPADIADANAASQEVSVETENSEPPDNLTLQSSAEEPSHMPNSTATANPPAISSQSQESSVPAQQTDSASSNTDPSTQVEIVATTTATSDGEHAVATQPPQPVIEEQSQDADNAGSRGLNVRDALVYLEDVKRQFADNLAVYNRFLDIMKEFKSHAIDTPGVIDRVLDLFGDNMALIIGFNTFLPPGYKIEVATGGVRVTTPQQVKLHHIAQVNQHSSMAVNPTATHTAELSSATAMSAVEPGDTFTAATTSGPVAMEVDDQAPQSQSSIQGNSALPSLRGSELLDSTYNASASGGHASTSSNFNGPSPVAGSQQPPQTASTTYAASSHTVSPAHGSIQHHHTGQSQSTSTLLGTSAGASRIVGSPGTQAASLPAHVPRNAPNVSSTSTGAQPPRANPQPTEFNHAITFVNKIKNRFASQPDIYKQFLEILQQYQKENKPLKEVYSHVQILFRDAEDLLSEFKQFLPDPNAGAAPAASTHTEMRPGNLGAHGTTGAPQPSPSQPSSIGGARLPPIGTFPSYSTGISVTSDSYARTNTYTSSMASLAALAPGVPTGSGNNHKKKRDQQASVVDISRKRQRQQLINPTSTGTTDSKTTASADELAFFDRVKRHLTNKKTYTEFTKILNLFSQEIVDRKQVVELVEPFLGNRDELFGWFKLFVGYDSKQDAVVNDAPPREKIDLSKCKSVGTSYRLLPLSDQKLPCSGRESLCYEVLNDVYVSHPTWASEDQEFIAHRKNQFEEAMHRCEEERYEYDLYIEANLHTIALLEPIARRIETMTTEERTDFRLPDGLGGASKTIYRRVIRRVYNDRADQIIHQLMENPANSVPVVLNRLKQKDEECKRAQRESNKIWRDIETRNYYKALDNQGINFKSNDKRALSAKSLLEKVEAIYKEQMGACKKGDPRPAYQFEFNFRDLEVVQDITSLLKALMDRQGIMSHADREHVEDFILGFLKDFFGLRQMEGDRLERLNLRRMEHDGRNGTDEAASEIDRDDALSTVSHDSDMDLPPSRRARGRETSLRRNVLRRVNADRTDTQDAESMADTEEATATSTTGQFLAATGAKPEVDGESAPGPTQSAGGSDEDKMDVEPTHPPPGSSGAGVGKGNGNDNHDSNGDDNAAVHMTDSAANEDPAHVWIHLQRDLESARLDGSIRDGSVDGKQSPNGHTVAANQALNCYGNNAFYIFFRLYETLYSRLHALKEEAAGPAYPRKPNKIADGLQIHHRLPSLSDYDLENDSYYQIELDVIARHFSGEMDKIAFEDSTRYLFGTKGYTLFTILYLTQSILRQIQSIVSDNTCLSLMDIFRQYGRGNQRQQTTYWAKAESLLSGTDDHLYRFEYVSEEVYKPMNFRPIKRVDFETNKLRIQYINSEDGIDEQGLPKEELWLRYIESFAMVTPTAGVQVTNMPYLPGNLPEEQPQPDDSDTTSHNSLKVSICYDTYKMSFPKGTYWFLRRNRGQPKDKVQSARIHRHRAWRNWLNGSEGWRNGLAASISKHKSDSGVEQPADDAMDVDDTASESQARDGSTTNRTSTGADHTNTTTGNEPSEGDEESNAKNAESLCIQWLTYGEKTPNSHPSSPTVCEVQHVQEDWANYRVFRCPNASPDAAAASPPPPS